VVLGRAIDAHAKKKSPNEEPLDGDSAEEATFQHEGDTGSVVRSSGFQKHKNVTKIFVIVPGWSDPQLKPVLLHNILWLRQQNQVSMTCVIYENFIVLLTDSEIQPCLLESWDGQLGESIVNVSERLWSDQDLVLVWYSGIALQPGATLNRMVEVMACNGLSVLTPSHRYESDDDSTRVPTPVMSQHWQFSRLPAHRRPRSQVGRKVNQIQWQFVLMTPESFRCLRKLILPGVNPTGAGSEELFPMVCAGRCMGVLDETTMYDVEFPSVNLERFAEEKEKLFDKLGAAATEPENLGPLQDPIRKCGGHADWPQQDWFSHPHPVAPLPPNPEGADPEEKHLPWIIAWNASPEEFNNDG